MTTPGDYDTDVSDMLAVHRALLGAMDAAPDYVGHAGIDQGRVDTVASFYENVVEFLHVHHAGEDELLYPLLEGRCAESKSVLERIDDQHKLLYSPMDEARAALAAWRAAPSPEHAAAVTNAIATLDVTLRPHLAEEEATVLPIAAKWCSAEEWGMLPGHAMMNYAGDKPFVPLGLIWEQFDDGHRAGMLAGMPPDFATAWTEQLSPAYDAFIAGVRQ